MIKFKCVCGKHLETDEKYAGRDVKCPVCQQMLKVPQPEIERDDDWVIKQLDKSIEKEKKQKEKERKIRKAKGILFPIKKKGVWIKAKNKKRLAETETPRYWTAGKVILVGAIIMSVVAAIWIGYIEYNKYQMKKEMEKIQKETEKTFKQLFEKPNGGSRGRGKYYDDEKEYSRAMKLMKERIKKGRDYGKYAEAVELLQEAKGILENIKARWEKLGIIEPDAVTYLDNTIKEIQRWIVDFGYDF